MSTGISLVTKGVAGGGEEVVVVTLAPPPSEPAQLEAAAPHGTVMIVVPTAINTVLMASENIVDNLKVRQAASLELPSLYKRAFLIAYETDEFAVAKEQ